eukprot:NODE_1213_length_952_cov_96.191515_g1167_i0.p1 GENE.NODE_1213_length_952_cov_96.191515_g1167_i0~~NODE_1213_length_952_cov_96.191515_g1167_i0.p1  ORF type:complete len:237 (-),score=56.62 NODE_1213_length_952_cov_96.191515_g1167_i0:159-869(-)
MPAPESKKKAAKAAGEAAAKSAQGKQQSAADKKVKRQEIVKRASKYARAYRAQAKQLSQFRQQSKNGTYYIEPEAKVAFVIRIRGINDMPPKPKKILELLRLKGIFNGVFLKLNKPTLEMLQRVVPYVTFGYPSLATIRRLLLKRGYVKLNGQRLKIESNDVIEQGLGKHGIICVDDLIHQIYTCGDKFKEANNFLWPFKLSAPNGGLKQKRRHFVENGDAGNRESFINPLVKRML